MFCATFDRPLWSVYDTSILRSILATRRAWWWKLALFSAVVGRRCGRVTTISDNDKSQFICCGCVWRAMETPRVFVGWKPPFLLDLHVRTAVPLACFHQPFFFFCPLPFVPVTLLSNLCYHRIVLTISSLTGNTLNPMGIIIHHPRRQYSCR